LDKTFIANSKTIKPNADASGQVGFFQIALARTKGPMK
jgi:hypothetical protein